MDDLKISFYGEREINVYEDKGTVVCRLVGRFGIEDVVGYGVARCRPNDTFDKEKGVRIATALAENNVYRKALKIARRVRIIEREQEKYSRNTVKAYTRFIEKAEKTVSHNREYIKRVDEGKVTYRKNKKH